MTPRILWGLDVGWYVEQECYSGAWRLPVDLYEGPDLPHPLEGEDVDLEVPRGSDPRLRCVVRNLDGDALAEAPATRKGLWAPFRGVAP